MASTKKKDAPKKKGYTEEEIADMPLNLSGGMVAPTPWYGISQTIDPTVPPMGSPPPPNLGGTTPSYNFDFSEATPLFGEPVAPSPMAPPTYQMGDPGQVPLAPSPSVNPWVFQQSVAPPPNDVGVELQPSVGVSPSPSMGQMPVEEAQAIVQTPEVQQQLAATIGSKTPDELKANLDQAKELGLIEPDIVKTLRRQLDSMADQGLPISLQPLASLVDTWTGSKMAPYIHPPLSPSQFIDKHQSLQNSLRLYQQNAENLAGSNYRSKLSSDRKREELAEELRRNKMFDPLKLEKLRSEIEKNRKYEPMGGAAAFKPTQALAARDKFLESTDYKKMVGYQSLMEAYKEMDLYVKTHELSKIGPHTRDFDALYASTMHLFSVASESGAMQEADKRVYELLTADPTKLVTHIQSLWKGGVPGIREGYKRSIDQYNKRWRSGLQGLKRRRGFDPNSEEYKLIAPIIKDIEDTHDKTLKDYLSTEDIEGIKARNKEDIDSILNPKGGKK